MEQKDVNTNDEQQKIDDVNKELSKIPVFIGCPDLEILNSLEDVILTKSAEIGKENVEVAAMSPELLKKSMELWTMMKMSSKEQLEFQEQKRDEHFRQHARMIAIGLCNNDNFKDGKKFNLKIFQKFQESRKQKMSNREADQILGLLMGYGYLKDTTPDAKLHEKWFQVNFTDEFRIEVFQENMKLVEDEIKTKQAELKILQDEIDTLTNNTANDSDKNNVTVDREPINDEGGLQVTTEHLNDISENRDDNNIKQ